MRLRRSVALLLLTQVLAQTPVARADPARSFAEYCGEDIDGQSFSASAFSYSTGKYYDVEVEFNGDEAIISFSNGGRLRLGLDDEEINDPQNISAFDYNRGVYWDLSVDGLDCDE